MHIDTSFYQNLYKFDDSQLHYGIKALDQNERNFIFSLSGCASIDDQNTCDQIITKIKNVKQEHYTSSNIIVRLVLGILNLLHLRISSTQVLNFIHQRKNGAQVISPKKSPLKPNNIPKTPNPARFVPPIKRTILPEISPNYGISFKIEDDHLLLSLDQANVIKVQEFWEKISSFLNTQETWSNFEIPGIGIISRENLRKCIAWGVDMEPLKLLEWHKRMEGCNGWDLDYDNSTIIALITGRKDKLDFTKPETLTELNASDQSSLDATFLVTITLGHHEIACELIKAGADVNTGDYLPFQIAAENNDTETTKMLIANHANFNFSCKECLNPLAYFFYMDNLEAAKLCIDRLGDINHLDSFGYTLLHHSILSENVKMVELVLCREPDLDIFSEDCWPPLLMAITHKNFEAFKLILEKVKDINAPFPNGMTPLQAAVVHDNLHMANWLLEKRAAVDLKNSDGYSALAMAVYNNKLEMVKLLFDKGANISEITVKIPAHLNLLEFSALQENSEVYQELIRRGAKKVDNRESAIDLLTNLAFQDPKNYQQIYSKLSDVPLENIKAHTKHQLKAISVGHSFEIGDTITLHPLEATEPQKALDLMGASSQYWIKKTLKGAKLFNQKYVEHLGNDCYQKFSETLTFTLENHNRKEKLLERLSHGEPTILLTGPFDHAVAILVWGDYFAMCDRSDKCLEVFRYCDVENFPDVLADIITANMAKQDFFNDLKECLPDDLQFRTKSGNDFESILEDSFPFGKQTADNCSYACLEGIYWVFFILYELDEMSEIGINDLKKVIATKSKDSETFRTFMQAFHLERYLGERIIRPTKNKTEDKGFSLNSELVSKAFSNVSPEMDTKIASLFSQLKKFEHIFF